MALISRAQAGPGQASATQSPFAVGPMGGGPDFGGLLSRQMALRDQMAKLQMERMRQDMWASKQAAGRQEQMYQNSRLTSGGGLTGVQPGTMAYENMQQMQQQQKARQMAMAIEESNWGATGATPATLGGPNAQMIGAIGVPAAHQGMMQTGQVLGQLGSAATQASGRVAAQEMASQANKYMADQRAKTAKYMADLQSKTNLTLGEFEDGGRVPKTGTYKLHKDEVVVPKNAADVMFPYMGMNGPKKGTGKPIKSYQRGTSDFPMELLMGARAPYPDSPQEVTDFLKGYDPYSKYGKALGEHKYTAREKEMGRHGAAFPDSISKQKKGEPWSGYVKRASNYLMDNYPPMAVDRILTSAAQAPKGSLAYRLSLGVGDLVRGYVGDVSDIGSDVMAGVMGEPPPSPYAPGPEGFTGPQPQPTQIGAPAEAIPPPAPQGGITVGEQGVGGMTQFGVEGRLSDKVRTQETFGLPSNPRTPQTQLRDEEDKMAHFQRQADYHRGRSNVLQQYLDEQGTPNPQLEGMVKSRERSAGYWDKQYASAEKRMMTYRTQVVTEQIAGMEAQGEVIAAGMKAEGEEGKQQATLFKDYNKTFKDLMGDPETSETEKQQAFFRAFGDRIPGLAERSNITSEELIETISSLILNSLSGGTGAGMASTRLSEIIGEMVRMDRFGGLSE